MSAAQSTGPQIIVLGQRQPGRGLIEVVGSTPDDPEAPTVIIDDDGSIRVETGTPEEPEPEPSRNFKENLAEVIDENALSALAGYLLDGIRADEDSRQDWLETANLAARYLGIKLEEPTTSVSADGTVSKTIATCMMKAVAKLWSTARAELLPVGGPVKVRRDDMPDTLTPSGAPKPPAPPSGPPVGVGGEPPGGQLTAPTPPPTAGIAATQPGLGHNGGPPMDPDDLADALEADFNHYLTVTDREYYPDFSKMLFSRALIGMAFRKVYRDPLKRRPLSRWVRAQNLIISNDCTHLSGAGRVTEYIPMRQSVMARMQKSGWYADVALTQPTGEVSETEQATAEIEGIAAAPTLPSDYEHKVYECYTELSSSISVFGSTPDLMRLERDENGRKPGYPLPYRVSIDKDSRKVLEIRRNWRPGDPDHTARETYVKYGFIPGIGFYDSGMIHVAGNATQAATMMQRATVDGTLYASFPGGLYIKSPASRQSSTVYRPAPGQFYGIDGGGAGKIQDVIMPMPYRDPSPQILTIIQKFESDVAELAGIIDLPVGEGRIGNTPVGTIMSYIEAVSQVPGAVHKDDHIAQQREFELLRDLFEDDPEALWRGRKNPAYRWQVAAELADQDLVPAADPNTPSAVHRLTKLQGLVQLSGLPQFAGMMAQDKVLEKALRVLDSGDPSELIKPPQAAPPPPPDPRIVAAQIKAQSQQQSDATKVQVAQQTEQSRAAQLIEEGTQRDADRRSDETRAAMSLEAARIKVEGDAANTAAGHAHDAAQQGADRIQSHVQHVTGLASAQQQANQQAASDAATQTPEGGS